MSDGIARLNFSIIRFIPLTKENQRSDVIMGGRSDGQRESFRDGVSFNNVLEPAILLKMRLTTRASYV